MSQIVTLNGNFKVIHNYPRNDIPRPPSPAH